MRSIEKQRQHVIFVMHAYAIVSVRKKLMGVDCVEDVIKHLRAVKNQRYPIQNSAKEGNFGYVA